MRETDRAVRGRVAQRKPDECLRACVAQMLGLDYDALPDISAETSTPEAFWNAWCDWAQEAGYEMLFYYDGMPAAADWIAVVPSLNKPGFDHAVLMHHARLVNDPASHGLCYLQPPPKAKYGITLERKGE